MKGILWRIIKKFVCKLTEEKGAKIHNCAKWEVIKCNNAIIKSNYYVHSL